jgi:6-phosphofructokinase 1
MSYRIGIVTGGGDCPGPNAVIRTVTTAAAKRGWETIGLVTRQGPATHSDW